MSREATRPSRWPLLALLAVVSVACFWRIRLLGDIRHQLAAFYGFFALAFAGYLGALWLVQWIAAQEPAIRRPGLAVGLILLSGLAARALLLGTQPVLSGDIYRYRWDGRVQQAGIDPYAHPPDAQELAFLREADFAQINFAHLRTVYPPVMQVAFRLGTVVGGTLRAQKVVFVAAELLIIASLLVLLGRRRLSPLWVVAYAWHPLVILEIAGSGHNDTIALAALWVGVAAWHVRAWWAAAVGWAAAFLSKLASVILLPWWWFRREARAWLAVFVVLAGLPLAVHPGIVSALVESLTAVTERVASNASVFVLLVKLVGHPGMSVLIAIGLCTAFLLWWARREDDPVRYLLGGFGVALLLSPALHPWYLVWLVPCFCFWRLWPLVALSGTAVLAYAVWPGFLAEGRWVLPVWAHVLEYAPVILLGLWPLGPRLLRKWPIARPHHLRATGSSGGQVVGCHPTGEDQGAMWISESKVQHPTSQLRR